MQSVMQNVSPNMESSISEWPSWSVDWLEGHPVAQLGTLASTYQPWICSVVAASAIGLAGIVPLVFIPGDYDGRSSSGRRTLLPLLLSFAVGGLLGDVFLHLLPEAWSTAMQAGASHHEAFSQVGMWVLAGIFVFIVVEMLATIDIAPTESSHDNNNTEKMEDLDKNRIEVSGYLNLVANSIDNFTHGLAVAGSFLVSWKTGALTTVAILIHEVPHEIGDFAILLKSGFSRWEAAKAQMYTACVGLIGALFTLFIGTSEILAGFQVYILGFTAGGFLNIALVTVLPDLLKEESPSQSFLQLLFLLLGMLTMGFIAVTC